MFARLNLSPLARMAGVFVFGFLTTSCMTEEVIRAASSDYRFIEARIYEEDDEILVDAIYANRMEFGSPFGNQKHVKIVIGPEGNHPTEMVYNEFLGLPDGTIANLDCAIVDAIKESLSMAAQNSPSDPGFSTRPFATHLWRRKVFRACDDFFYVLPAGYEARVSGRMEYFGVAHFIILPENLKKPTQERTRDRLKLIVRVPPALVGDALMAPFAVLGLAFTALSGGFD